MAAVRLARQIAAHNLHRPEGAASDRRRTREIAGRLLAATRWCCSPRAPRATACACCHSAPRWSARSITRSADSRTTAMSPCSRCRWPMSASAGCRWAGPRASAWRGTAMPISIPHLLQLLSSGAVDVTVSWGEAIAYDRSADRKAIARASEQSVRRMTAAALRPRAGAYSTAAGTGLTCICPMCPGLAA